MLGLREVNLGDYVSSGTEIVALASITELQIDIRVPEQYLTQITLDTPVHLRLDAQEGQEFVGKIKAISPLLDEQGRSVVLRAYVANPDGQLRPGQFARATLDLAELNALMVPETALAPAGQSQYVYRVAEGNKAQRVAVTVGLRRDGWVQVSGLAADDRVLTSGLQKVQDGSKIKLQDQD